MTLQIALSEPPERHAPTHPTPRLRLKAKAPRSGAVDGAWWPRSDDLTAELPDLLAVLSVRLGPIARVTYGFSEWRKAAAKYSTGGRDVRLDGYHRQPPNTLGVLGVNGAGILLLVVPPSAGPDQAHATMMAAAGTDNDATVAALLLTTLGENTIRPDGSDIYERWDSDGGAGSAFRD